MLTPRLLAVLPRDRHRPGALALVDASREEEGSHCRLLLAGPWPVLGRAGSDVAGEHGNPTRDPLRPWGDTPLGLYRIGGVQRSKEPARTYGLAYWELIAEDGDALRAVREGGRSGLGLHGGELAPDGETLRPTGGCLRIEDTTCRELLALMGEPGRWPRFLEVVEGGP